MKFLLLFVAFAVTASAQAPHSIWAYPGPDGRLVYKTTPRGDRIADFSNAGYMGGGVALPAPPVAETLAPSTADDTAAVQAALTRVAARAAAMHEAQALLLAPGVFHLSDTLHLSASNVVLRGSGVDRTTLTLTGKPHLALSIAPADTHEDDDHPPTATPAALASTTLAPTYIPGGTHDLPVVSAAGFAAGDTILITHPITPAYLHFMGMDNMVRDGKAEHWTGASISTERRIASVHDRTLVLEVPITDSYDPQFGGGLETRVAKIAPPQRLSQVGVELLRILAPVVKINLTDPHFDAIQLTAVEDAWIRGVRIENTINDVTVTSSARRITIDRVDISQPVPIQSSAKNFGFSLAGAQTLVLRSSVTADKIFFAATQARTQGPNVLLQCTFRGDTALEPHQRWATGLLIDNVHVTGGGAINLLNRGGMGSGHGWAIGWGVLWNSSAATLTVQSPPGAINWAIGSSGTREGKPMPVYDHPKGGNLAEGTFDSYDKSVAPASLYLQQLADRLGRKAIENINK